MRAGLSPQPQSQDVPHNFLDLCQYHKDLFLFFSMRTYLFMFSCLFLFLCISTSLDFHMSLIKGHLEPFQRLTQEGSTFFFCGYFHIPNLDWECLEFGTSCGYFMEFSLDVPDQDHTLLHIVLFYSMKHISL